MRYFDLGFAVIGLGLLLLPAQQPTTALTPGQTVEYYRQGAALQYKQLLAANQRIAELEARIESDRLEKEATTALREMAEWRRRVLGDARCTIEEPGAKVTCPLGVTAPEDWGGLTLSPADTQPNSSGDGKQIPPTEADHGRPSGEAERDARPAQARPSARPSR